MTEISCLALFRKRNAEATKIMDRIVNGFAGSVRIFREAAMDFQLGILKVTSAALMAKALPAIFDYFVLAGIGPFTLQKRFADPVAERE